MRVLRSCDFCGEEAIGTFEVIPEGFDIDAHRRRVVLCENCKGELETLLDPLIAYAETGGTAPQNDSNDGDSPDSGTASEEDETEGTLLGGGSDANGPLLGGGTEESTGAVSTDQSSDDGDTTGDDTGESDDESAITEEASDRSEPEQQKGETKESQSTEHSTSSPPDNYGKVLRLLRNREFPMTREEVVTLATGAYQLDAGNVQAVIDEAVQRGEFIEANGQLKQA